MIRKALWIGIWLLALLASAIAGPSLHVKWSAKIEPSDLRAGEKGQVLVTAEVAPGYHIYATDVKDAIPTKLALQPGGNIEAAGDPIYPPSKTYFDEGFEKELGKYEGKVLFAVPFRLKTGVTGPQKVTVTVRSQACNERGCDMAGDDPQTLVFTVSPGEPRPEGSYALTSIASTGTEESNTNEGEQVTDEFAKRAAEAKNSGLLPFMAFSFLMGLLALLTPCVFPMIPITVSFFSKKTADSERKTNFGGALAYCLGIISTFTALGLIITIAVGPTGIQGLANNVWVNAAIFIVFVALGLSLFGMFEIAVPSGVLNALGSKGKAVGFVGPVLMGLTFSLTSFTCTVPIVGTILAGAATGERLYPIVGMIAFSIAFALPFFFLALFPSLITKLPRSGAWLGQVKIFMGFLELAAALKFLSNIELVFGLGWLTEPVFLTIWFGIALVAGLQLLGVIRLGHEPGGEPIGWIRRGFGVAMLAAAVWMLSGLRGGNLGDLAAFLPPNPYPGHKSSSMSDIGWKYDYSSGLAEAKKQGKPMFIDFTGVNCTNCRWMEKNMFTRKEVRDLITSYVPVELYTDRGTPEDLANQKLMQKLSGTVTLPVYVLMGPNEKIIKVFQGSTRDVDEYVAFLKSAQK